MSSAHRNRAHPARWRWRLLFVCGVLASASATGGAPARAAAPEPLFTNNLVPQLRIEIPAEGMEVLRRYRQVWGKPRPERVDVKATVLEGEHVYTNVAVHLKGSFTFEPVDNKPSLTLNFDKFVPGQRFRGLDKIHLNNSVQDPTYLCEALTRELFNAAGVPSPRAGHARATLNDRELGAFVVIEGSNKRFLKRHFKSAKGNLYDGGSGGDITKQLKVDSGEDPENRSDLEALVAATKEPDPGRRLARLQGLLDVDRFLAFAALEVLLQHWDGYCLGPNNYRVFHDTDRDRMVFMPHGLDQVLGVGQSSPPSINPHWDGVVAKALFSTSEGRRGYLERLGQVFTNQLRAETLVARVDQMAGRLRPILAPGLLEGLRYTAAVENLKGRIQRRAGQVQEQLTHPEQPLAFGADGTVTLADWRYRNGTQRRASGRRLREEGRDLLEVRAAEPGSSGSWRTTVLLDAGQYELTGLGRVAGVPEGATNTGVLLRISGERSTKGLSIATNWVPLRYVFDVQGLMNTELLCEFRGSEGAGSFDARTLRLRRRQSGGK